MWIIDISSIIALFKNKLSSDKEEVKRESFWCEKMWSRPRDWSSRWNHLKDFQIFLLAILSGACSRRVNFLIYQQKLTLNQIFSSIFLVHIYGDIQWFIRQGNYWDLILSFFNGVSKFIYMEIYNTLSTWENIRA